MRKLLAFILLASVPFAGTVNDGDSFSKGRGGHKVVYTIEVKPKPSFGTVETRWKDSEGRTSGWKQATPCPSGGSSVESSPPQTLYPPSGPNQPPPSPPVKVDKGTPKIKKDGKWTRMRKEKEPPLTTGANSMSSPGEDGGTVPAK